MNPRLSRDRAARAGAMVLILLVLLAAACASTAPPIPTRTPSLTPVPSIPPPTATHLPGLGPGWTAFTAADGIVEREDLHAIAVAPDGTLWLGTRWDGVLRFDGETWTTYTTADGLAHYNVLSLTVGPAGGIWAGTEQGVSRFDGRAWVSYRRSAYCRAAYCPEPERVSSIAVAPDGALWFGTLHLQRFDGETWTDPRPCGDDAPWPLQAFAITPEGDFWLGSPEGAFHFDGQDLTPYTTADGLVHNSVEAIAVAPDGALWFGTYRGVSCFDGQRWSTVDRLLGKRVRDIAVAPDGAFWFVTVGGIYRYVPETVTVVEPSPSPVFTPIPTQTPTITPPPTQTPIPSQTPTPSSTPTPLPEMFQPVTAIEEILPGEFRRLHAAPDGALWLITDRGVARLTDAPGSVYLTDLAGDPVSIDAANRVWVVSEDTTEITVWDDDTWTAYGADEGWASIPPEDGWHREVAWGKSDGSGRFWLATSQDVRVFDDGRWTVFTPEEMGMGEAGPEELWATFTLEVAEGTGTVWVGECDWCAPGPFGGQGVRWFDGQTWHGADSPVAYDCTAAVKEDSTGRVWMGVAADLWRYDPASGDWARFAPPEDPPVEWQRYGVITDIALDSSGDPWITMLLCGGACCDNLVLYHVHDGDWIQVGEVGLHPGSFVDIDGAPWYIGTGGIYRIVGTALEPAVPLQARSVTVDGAGQVWFVAWHRGAERLWTIDPGRGD